MHFISKNIIAIFIATFVISSGLNAQECVNKLANRIVRAAGDWTSLPQWNAAEPLGLMKFDEEKCVYTLAVGGLRPNTVYKWKVKYLLIS
jgi:hypothetical protein